MNPTRFRTGRLLSSLLVTAALGGCSDDPTSTSGRRPPSYLISDAVHSGGKPHFYFLPPMVPNPSVAGVFDESLSPEVAICEWTANACGAELARFTMTSGPGSETIRVGDGHYIVNWHTDRFDLSAATTYRIRVTVGPWELGFADVDVVASARELRNVNTGEYIPLVDGRTLPIKFRIERGFLARLEVVPVDATVETGGTQQFVAELYDLHGEPLVGPAVSWSSSDPGVAGVDANGLATAVNDGEATITASAAGVSGSATLTVEGGAIVVEVGGNHSCALKENGQAFCWGYNTGGQLGDGTTINRLVPGPVSGGLVFSAISAMGSFGVGAGARGWTCGVTTAASLYCWGSNNLGQLGDGTTTNRLTPVAIKPALQFMAVDGGSAHTCGLTTTGVAHCWGFGFSGQLGGGSPVAGPHIFASIASGEAHSCGVKANGEAWCWGANSVGQVGDGSVFDRFVPTKVTGSQLYQKLVGGSQFTCGLTTTGQVYCWGRRDNGQLGDGVTAPFFRAVPAPVNSGSLVFTDIAAGGFHACGLTASGQAYCWGGNNAGQLGDGTTIQRTTPVPVAGTLQFSELSGSFQHTCGLSTTGDVYCWGLNSVGQVGDGTTTRRLEPTLVNMP